MQEVRENRPLAKGGNKFLNCEYAGNKRLI